MSPELTQDEKEKAAKAAAEAEKEKSKIDQIGDQLTGVQELLKSHVASKEKKEEEHKEAEIDFTQIDPIEMAKSFGDDKEKSKEFIKKFCDECGVNPQDMVDPDGNQYIDEEMFKSLQEAEAITEKYLAGIVYSMQETNERNAVKDAVIMEVLSTLAKSVSSQNEIVSELQKSMSGEKKEEEPEKKEEGEIEVPTLESGDPLTELDTVMMKSYQKTDLKKAIRSAFPGSYGNNMDQEKRFKYEELAEKFPVDQALEMIRDATDRSLVESYLPN